MPWADALGGSHSKSQAKNYWVSIVNPSYNLAAILDTFVGTNHPRYGKVVSQEVRSKIRSTLTGRKLTAEGIY